MILSLGSLFAGIGGFDLGFERAGFNTAFVCEIDKSAQMVLRRRFPFAELFDDVCKVGAHNLPAVDVLTFGSPCQDLSIAGRRAGLAGSRSGLFHEAARIIRELRERYGKPDFAVWENVPGAFSSNGGRDFAAVVQAMVDLGARDVAWRVLDSQFFGVAQRRRRVFLVADFGGERAEQILFEPESLRGDSATGRKARGYITRGVRARAAISGAVGALTTRILGMGAPEVDAGHYIPIREKNDWPARIASTLTCDFAEKFGQNNQHVDAGCPLFVPIAFHPTQDPISSQDGVMHTVSSGSPRGCASIAVCTTGEVTHTLTTTATKGATEDGTGRGNPTASQAMAVRRLTPTECERLQGFPDGWTSEGIDDAGRVKQQTDAPRYKQLGNAVTVNVAEWLARRMKRAVDESAQETMP